MAATTYKRRQRAFEGADQRAQAIKRIKDEASVRSKVDAMRHRARTQGSVGAADGLAPGMKPKATQRSANQGEAQSHTTTRGERRLSFRQESSAGDGALRALASSEDEQRARLHQPRAHARPRLQADLRQPRAAGGADALGCQAQAPRRRAAPVQAREAGSVLGHGPHGWPAQEALTADDGVLQGASARELQER
jgi:hypothetical protein